MRILFINPSRAGQGQIPLNIPILISVTKLAGHEVRLFDFTDYEVFEGAKQYESVFFKPADFDFSSINEDRRKFYCDDPLAPNGLELKKTDYLEDLENVINSFNPKVVAVSSLSVDYQFITQIISTLRQRHKFISVLGGIHAILRADEAIASKAYDFVAIGESERSLLDLLSSLESGTDIRNVAGYKSLISDATIDKPYNLTDITRLPPSDFDLFDPIHFYRPFDGKRYKMLNYEFSRGCPFNCSYCVNGVLKEKYKGKGRYHRFKSVAQSIEELKGLITKHKFNFIRYWDEDFTSLNAKVIEEYAEQYKKHINLPFLIYARVDTVTEKKIAVLKDMGCKTCAMGIESGSQRLRREVLCRNMSNSKIIESFQLVNRYGIRTSAYNMIGFPTETRDDIFDTIELNRLAGPSSFSVTMLEPYKGTPIRKLCEDEGLSPDHEAMWNEPQFIPRGMTKGELAGLFRTFPLYIRMPKESYCDIKKAETDDVVYHDLLNQFAQIK